jgi:hypothetical protein
METKPSATAKSSETFLKGVYLSTPTIDPTSRKF